MRLIRRPRRENEPNKENITEKIQGNRPFRFSVFRVANAEDFFIFRRTNSPPKIRKTRFSYQNSHAFRKYTESFFSYPELEFRNSPQQTEISNSNLYIFGKKSECFSLRYSIKPSSIKREKFFIYKH